MDTLNEEYVSKTMMQMVSDEGKRIMAQNLASKKDLSSILKPIIEESMEASGDNTLLNILATLHEKLSKVKLPGDFEKYAVMGPNSGHLLYDEINSGEEMTQPEMKDKMEEDFMPCEHCDGTGKAKPEEELDNDTDVMGRGELAIVLLEKEAYDLGLSGDHDGAYKKERAIMAIKETMELVKKNKKCADGDPK